MHGLLKTFVATATPARFVTARQVTAAALKPTSTSALGPNTLSPQQARNMAGWFSGGAGRRGGLAKDFFTEDTVIERERDITKQIRQEDRTREEQKRRRDRRKERVGLIAKFKKLTKRKRPTVDDNDFFLAGEPVPVPRERPYVVVGGGRSAPRRDRVVPTFIVPSNQLWWDCDNEDAHPALLSASELVSSQHCQVTRAKRGTRSKPYTVISIRHTPTGVQAEATTTGKGQVELRGVELHAAGRLRLALATYVRPTLHSESPPWSPGPELLGRCTETGEIAVEADDADMPVVLMDIMDAFYSNNLMVSKLCTAIDEASLFVDGPNDPGSIEPKEVVRLLAKHPAAIHLINRERQKLSMMTLKRQR